MAIVMWVERQCISIEKLESSFLRKEQWFLSSIWCEYWRNNFYFWFYCSTPEWIIMILLAFIYNLWEARVLGSSCSVIQSIESNLQASYLWKIKKDMPKYSVLFLKMKLIVICGIGNAQSYKMCTTCFILHCKRSEIVVNIDVHFDLFHQRF